MALYVGIDVGGTFTDIAVLGADGAVMLHKVASTPDRPEQALLQGLREAFAAHGRAAADVVRLAHGTTVGTNALIQRRVGTLALVTTEGFRDLLEIGRQTRPRVYNIHLDRPPPLVPRRRRFEVAERILADGSVRTPLDTAALPAIAEAVAAAGADAVIVCFLNAYANPAHERAAAEGLAAHLPDTCRVLASSDLYPEFREFERFSTAVLNGALLTVMGDYLDRFRAGVAALGVPVAPYLSQSAGGLMTLDQARAIPIRASLSGPAAGVTGAAARAAEAGFDRVITLDVGGTSADVALLMDGRCAEVQDRTLAGFPLRMPSLDVNAVGAGGGSIAWIDRDGLLKVGPDSAGAHPGPACYGQGAEHATLTDANVVLGRLNPSALLGGTMPIDAALSHRAVAALAGPLGLDVVETALGVTRIACAVMTRAIRTISVERGHDPAGFCLFAFGGAGPLHATQVARDLGIRTILVPPSPGVLCAEGLLAADLRGDFVRTLLAGLDADGLAALAGARDALRAEAEAWFAAAAVSPQDQRCDWVLEMRYRSQNFELPLALDPDAEARDPDALAARFHALHEDTYGYRMAGEPIDLVNLRVKALGLLSRPAPLAPGAGGDPRPVGSRPVVFEDGTARDTPVFHRDSLAPGRTLDGPLVVEQLDTTVLVHPGDRARVDAAGTIVITLGG
ncbi:hydantoinase/oxoprolinase family protein [Roseospira navarrensis]|uniref:Hydantoinase/oxoprolinase family protein n=1 Tax=Roseospira navarrensis TaxID=140058 RepID=A0A7X1ZGB8_9PROT|nr:hydantoinase/oxoprolinase family protein [Roseospira navarrensis]MQX37803.1 hydantoinase/oxoprolinase family protein [Roseospira navarrensis]